MGPSHRAPAHGGAGRLLGRGDLPSLQFREVGALVGKRGVGMRLGGRTWHRGEGLLGRWGRGADPSPQTPSFLTWGHRVPAVSPTPWPLLRCHPASSLHCCQPLGDVSHLPWP